MLALPNTIQVYVAIIATGLVINLALGLYLVLWDPRNPVNRLVSTIQGLLVIWGATSLIALVVESSEVTPATFEVLKINGLVNYFGSSFLGCTWLNLALLFPRRRPITHRPWLYLLLYLPNTLFYLLRLTNDWHGLFYKLSLENGQFTNIRGPLFLGFIVLTYSQVILANVLLIGSALRLDNALQRKQAAILSGATLLVLGGHIVRVVAPNLFLADPSILLLTFSGILYAYGVLRYRLMGLSIILSRAFVYGLTWLMLAGIIFVTISLARPSWRTLSTWKLTLIAFADFAFLFAIRTWLSDLVERSLNRGRQAHQQAVRDFMAQLTSVTGSEQLLPGVVEFIVETMYAENGTIIVRDQTTGHFHIRYSRGLDVQVSKYPPENAFFAYLRTLKQSDVLELAQVMAHPRYHGEREMLENHMRAWQAEVCLALKVQDELVGIMTFGAQAGGKSYTRDDIRLFSQIAHQMAISVYNVLYYDAIVAAQHQLASLNEELEQRVWERTQRLEERTQELARANKELQQAQQQIIQSEKLASIGQLAAGVAHEINNPVGVILGFSQYLQRRIPADDICAQPLATIERESMRCKQIVQNLLDFARMGEPRWLEVNLHQILDTTNQMLEFQLSKGKIDLITDYAPDLPSIIADPQQLQQIFINIILNAYQAMPQGGRLEIKTRANAQNVSVSFIDEGVGIPPEQLGKIFDPFFTTKEPGEGTGLGLAVSYGIVQRHGGQLQVESRIDRGSTFTVHLPITQDFEPPVIPAGTTGQIN